MCRWVVSCLGMLLLLAGSFTVGLSLQLSLSCCALALGAGILLGRLRTVGESQIVQLCRVFLLSGSVMVALGCILTTPAAWPLFEHVIGPIFETMFFNFGTFIFLYAVVCFVLFGFIVSSGSTSRE